MSCHGPLKQEAGLRLDTGALVRQGGADGLVLHPGRPDESELVRRIESTADDRMPPDGEPLTNDQRRMLRRWIATGAASPADEAPLPDPARHWAFQPVPTADATATIDEFIAARLTAVGLEPAPEADRRTLIRRLYLDVHGLPPTWEQVQAFVADDRPDAWAELVDAVLASPRYGERSAQHWLDVVRYADTHGFEVNTPRDNAWPYRDYVIRAFNEDRPYYQFIREQLAGDALGVDAATGFLVSAAVLLPGQIGKDEESIRLARQDALDEIIVGTSSTFLGLTLGCARCHDHKFDPLTQRDYYAWQAFFAGVEYGDRVIRDTKYEQQVAELAVVDAELTTQTQQLGAFESVVFPGRTLIIDEADQTRVEFLNEPNGVGRNPDGDKPGYAQDRGAADRLGNLSGGAYTWWDNAPGRDVCVYRPQAEGLFQCWISWGAHGSGVHTRDARYVFDQDGDLATADDQRELARVDQYYPAHVSSGTTEQQPLWSGLLDVGRLKWGASSALIVRGGETGTGITADVIVLQEVTDDALAAPTLPRLRPAVNPVRNVDRFRPVAARFVRFTSLATRDADKHEPCLDELEVYSAEPAPRNVALAASGTRATSSGDLSDVGRHQLPHINDGRYGNEQSWISNERGRGWVQLEFPAEVTIDRVVWSRDRNAKFKDRLPIAYEIAVSTDGKHWSPAAGHLDRLPLGTPDDPVANAKRNAAPEERDAMTQLVQRIAALQEQRQKLSQHPLVYGGVFRVPEGTFLLRRGDPEQRGEPTGPAIPSIFGAVSAAPESEQQRRQVLADWIAAPDNPLTARVLVNRIWQTHFGRGLVDTPNDFGLNGGRPSHPELLDWLASQFMRNGWSIKKLHRQILLSRTYRQSSRSLPRGAEIDGDNRWLWRFPTRRIEAEVIRDGLLAVSGRLNLEMYGPGFSFFKSRGGLSGFPPVETFTPAEQRRMIYAHKVRMEPVPVFGAFDCPDAGQSMPRRSQSTTALQALNLFNSPFVLSEADALAARLEVEYPDNVEARLSAAFHQTLGRDPSEQERSAAAILVREHGLATLARALVNSNEFLFIP